MTTVLSHWLRCPVCAADLHETGGCLVCPSRHAFDVARQGYVNLTRRPVPNNADTAPMLDARARFLAAGHYEALADAVAAAAGPAERIVEVGAGTGYYLARALEANPGARGLATDVSPAAAKRAARAHPRAGSIVADTWAGLPLRDGVADVVLCVFAPRNPAEFERVLSPGGTLVVAVPGADHLAELRERYDLLGVDRDKAEAVAASFPGWRHRRTEVRAQLELSADEVADLIAMGPNAFHGPPTTTAPTRTTLAVTVVSLTRP